MLLFVYLFVYFNSWSVVVCYFLTEVRSEDNFRFLRITRSVAFRTYVLFLFIKWVFQTM